MILYILSCPKSIANRQKIHKKGAVAKAAPGSSGKSGLTPPGNAYPCPKAFSVPYIPESTAQLGRYRVFMFQ